MGNEKLKNIEILIVSLIGLLLFGFLSQIYEKYFSVSIFVGAFGASTAILLTSPNEKVSSYRSLALGYLISCSLGVSLNYFFPSAHEVLKVALAVSIAIYLMRTLKAFHPAGGAIALLSATFEYDRLTELLIYFVGTSVIGPSLFYFIIKILNRNKL